MDAGIVTWESIQARHWEWMLARYLGVEAGKVRRKHTRKWLQTRIDADKVHRVSRLEQSLTGKTSGRIDTNAVTWESMLTRSLESGYRHRLVTENECRHGTWESIQVNHWASMLTRSLLNMDNQNKFTLVNYYCQSRIGTDTPLRNSHSTKTNNKTTITHTLL